MARPASGKEVKTINFEKIVLQRLKEYCKKANIPVSTFVNHHIRKLVMSEVEFSQEMAKHHCAEMNKWLMQTEYLKGETTKKVKEIRRE